MWQALKQLVSRWLHSFAAWLRYMNGVDEKDANEPYEDWLNRQW